MTRHDRVAMTDSTTPEPLVIAIDAGTQSIRAALVDAYGVMSHLVKLPIQPYYSTQPGWAEQDAEYYWSKLCEVTRSVLAAAGPDASRIAAAAVTTQRMTMIFVDSTGKPLRPAITWLDHRKADARKILPAAAIPAIKAAGLYPIAEYAVQHSRADWVQQVEPDVWARTAKYLYLSGYFTYRMTGEYRDSTGNMIGQVPYDVKRDDWCGRFDVKWRLFPGLHGKLPELVKPGQLIGHLNAAAAADTGLPDGLPLIASSNDKACDVVGAGCLTPDIACVSLGTTATINTQTTRYVELQRMLPPHPSAIPGQMYTEVGVTRGMWMVSWFKEEFGLQERLTAAEQGTAPEELLEQLIKDIPPGSMGLVVQPTWAPAPGAEAFAKGAVLGFGDVHTRGHLYRAILEGIVFGLKEGGLTTERKNKVPIREVRATGGGSRSDAIMQMLADIFDIPVYRTRSAETSVLGAAMNAFVGLGRFPDMPAAVKAMSAVADRFDPVPEHAAIYRSLYEDVYTKMYERLLPLSRAIQRITGYPEL